MKFVLPDTCLEDYEKRRSDFLQYVIKNWPDLKDRVVEIRRWLDLNSPYEPHEKLANLKRALLEDLNN